MAPLMQSSRCKTNDYEIVQIPLAFLQLADCFLSNLFIYADSFELFLSLYLSLHHPQNQCHLHLK